MIRRAVAVLTTLALPALAACGNSAPSKAEFLAKADPVCKRGNELAAVATTPSDLPGLKDFMVKLADNTDKTVKELEDQKFPGGKDGDAAKAWVKSMKDAAASARAVGGDVDGGNFTAVEDNAKKAADAYKTADGQARSYGSAECGRGEAEAAGRMQASLGTTVKTAYIAKADPVCTALEKELDAIPEPEGVGQIAGFVDKVVAAAGKAVADQRAIPQPRTDKDKLDAYFASVDAQIAKIRDLRSVTNEEQFASKFEAVVTASLDTAAKAGAYGFKECAKTD